MSYKRTISIKNKLIGIIFFISLISFGVIYITTIIRKINLEKEEFAKDYAITTKLIASYCIVPLDFGFNEEIDKIFENLKTQPNILSACLYNSEGKIFSCYQKESSAQKLEIPKRNENTYFTANSLIIYEPLFQNNKEIGKLYMQISLDSFNSEISLFKREILLTISLQLILVYFLAYFLQRIITNPILKLHNFALEIGKNHDYSKRIATIPFDEIGILYSSFNSMIETVEMREQQINKDKLALKEKNEEYLAINEELQEKNAELLQAKKVATENEKKFKSMIDTSPLAIYMSNGIEQKAEYINPTFIKLFGYEPEEISDIFEWFN